MCNVIKVTVPSAQRIRADPFAQALIAHDRNRRTAIDGIQHGVTDGLRLVLLAANFDEILIVVRHDHSRSVVKVL